MIMKEKNMFEVIKTLELMIKRLKKIGIKQDVDRVQNWLTILKDKPSKSDLNELWSEIQHIGGHMGYMDYLDNEFDELRRKLISQMLDLIVVIRKR
jgi:hypothetical protein